MEERLELPDFDEWLKNYKPPVIKYVAAFDLDSGKVLSIGPDYALKQDGFKNVIDIDSHVAEKIISGDIRISNCFVDPTMGKLEIVEVKNLSTIDDVMHRIIEKQWSEVEKPEIYLTHQGDKLKIELSEEFGGTYKLDQKHHPIAKRKIFWDGSTVMSFLITDYNDPHKIHNILEIKIEDVVDNFKEFKINTPQRFSIFTRRLFKNYVLEMK